MRRRALERWSKLVVGPAHAPGGSRSNVCRGLPNGPLHGRSVSLARRPCGVARSAGGWSDGSGRCGVVYCRLESAGGAGDGAELGIGGDGVDDAEDEGAFVVVQGGEVCQVPDLMEAWISR